MNDGSNFDISLSSFQHQPPFDSFDVSEDISDNPNPNPNNLLNEKPKRPVPQLSNLSISPDLPPVGIVSPGSSNIPTHGDVRSPKEDTSYGGVNSGGNWDPSLNNTQSNRQRHHRPEGETEIFSFRRERDPVPDTQDQSGTEGNQNGPLRNEQGEDVVLMSEQDTYDRTRGFFIKLKKLYMFFILNAGCIALIVFNFYVAYTTEHIQFPLIETIDRQFQQRIILDIDLAAKTKNCSEQYVKSTMGTWPGYSSVCECNSQAYIRQCTQDDLLAGCRNTRPMDPVPISIWDGRKICLRKSDKTLLQYYETSNFMESYNGNFMCPNALKKCIISAKKNFICVGRFEFCPVTQIMIEKNREIDKNRYKAQLPFDNSMLVYDNQGAATASFLDIIVEHQICTNRTGIEEDVNTTSCHNGIEKYYLDNLAEYKVVMDNVNKDQDKYFALEKTNENMTLSALPMNYLDMCVFNNTFNPVILNSQLMNWTGVKYLLFTNPFFISTLLIINLIRVFMIRYINEVARDRVEQKRKREIYNMFGRSFSGASVVVITQVVTILYYIFWGYLLLNPDRLIAEKWLDMTCITPQVRKEIQYMIAQFTKIETYNMMTIGPMILGCIMEALFSQYKMITQPYNQLVPEN